MLLIRLFAKATTKHYSHWSLSIIAKRFYFSDLNLPSIKIKAFKKSLNDVRSQLTKIVCWRVQSKSYKIRLSKIKAIKNLNVSMPQWKESVLDQQHNVHHTDLIASFDDRSILTYRRRNKQKAETNSTTSSSNTSSVSSCKTKKIALGL